MFDEFCTYQLCKCLKSLESRIFGINVESQQHTHKHNAQKTHCSVIIILHVTQSMPRATTASTLKTVRTYTVRFERKFNVPLSLPFLFFFSSVAVLLSSDIHTTHEHAPRPLKGTNLFQTIFSLSMFVSDNPTKERNEIAALHR